MDLHLLFDNLTNPALLFFVLGIIAAQVKSDLEIPKNSSKFILRRAQSTTLKSYNAHNLTAHECRGCIILI